jgi:glycosyltransferase involved in cell wall biosynthesis/SAM-dependent methyltransferase
MKIAWVTPYNSRSGIGGWSRMVAGELSDADHAVTIVRSESKDLLDGSSALPASEVLRWDEVCYVPDFWGRFDAVVYNIGDNYPFHAGAIELVQRFPGLVIFHDYFLLDLFRKWCVASDNLALGDRILDDLYGEGTARRLHAIDGGPDFWEYATEHFPMTEWMARFGHGSVAHSSFYADRLKRCCGGPVAVITPAYDPLSEFRSLAEREQRSSVVVLTVGHVNQNKRVESVIRAIGGSDVLRDRCRYQVVGLVTDQERERLRAVAQAVSFHNLEITGEVSNEILRALIEAADIICCLRWPVFEGSSATAGEGMLSGRPIIVTDAGFYHELPDDLVFKVDPTSELSSLTSQLTRLTLDPALRATVGARAAAWAKTEFSVHTYVARLVPFLEEVARLRPTLRVAAHFGQIFSDLGLRPNDPAVERLEATLEGLFIKNNDGKIQATKTLEASRNTQDQHAQPINQATPNTRPWRYPNLTQAEIAAYQQRIDQITNRHSPSGWFHSLELGNGLFAPGQIKLDVLRRQVEWLHLPEDLTGQSFIDLGSWDGFYAFEAEQRGAARVLATDSFSWNGMGWSNKQGFLLARDILRSQVEDMDIDIIDVCPERVGVFDVVLFSGMLYHMRDPIKALQNAASVCKNQLIIETAVGMLDVKEPAMVYLPRVPGEEQSNHWRPNPQLINLWLKELGFREIDYRIDPFPLGPLGFFNALR